MVRLPTRRVTTMLSLPLATLEMRKELGSKYNPQLRFYGCCNAYKTVMVDLKKKKTKPTKKKYYTFVTVSLVYR